MEDDENLSRPLLSIRPDSSFTASSSVARLRSSSECDVVNQEGNYQLREPINSSENNQSAIEIQQNRWDLNYREAAIYLQEGENNDKFSAHPRDQVDLPAYMITHNTWFYLLTLFASLVLLTLALVEYPSVMAEPLPISIHASIELVALIIIAIELVLKVKWLGWYSFVRHIRTMIEVVILCIMFAEAITVIVRRTNHFRVTRALRPVFLLDSYYCRGVRRFIRQIIQSLPPIIDMLVLLIFFILLFSMLGFYLFSSMPNDTYFQSIFQSFISLFILLTTANFPDVMMPAYKATKWSSVFFIIYISIELFLFMNLFLAVVYSAFMKIEKEKFKKLLLHRRSACQAAFQLLVSGQNPNFLSCKNFAGCLKYFRPRMRRRDIYLVFKSLNVSHSGKLSAEEFTSIYDVVSLKWKRKSNKDLWSSNFVRPFNRICYGLNRLVTIKWFDYFIHFVIFSNFIWILFDTVRISYCKQAATDSSNYSWYEDEKNFIWVSMVFVVIYVVEAAMKIFGLGPQRYFSSGWNIFDFVVTVVALFGVLLQYANNGFYYIVIIRPLRVLRLFKLKRRYRDVFGTLFILFSRMISLGIVMLLLFYFFAIIGMEVFAPYTSQLKNCCSNTSVEKDYIYNETSGLDGYYYLNTFENLLVSGVTLFELTVVNNWWIIMEGFASVTSPWSRLYFMIFYLIIMVVMTVVVAFVLEAFIFRIQYRQKMQGQGQDMEAYTVKKVDVSLTPDEMRMCESSDSPLTGRYIPCSQETRQTEILAIPPDDSQFVWFRGQKMLSKRDFSARMYSSEVKEWISNDVNLPSERQTEIPLQSLSNDEVVIV